MRCSKHTPGWLNVVQTVLIICLPFPFALFWGNKDTRKSYCDRCGKERRHA